MARREFEIELRDDATGIPGVVERFRYYEVEATVVAREGEVVSVALDAVREVPEDGEPVDVAVDTDLASRLRAAIDDELDDPATLRDLEDEDVRDAYWREQELRLDEWKVDRRR